MAAQHGAEGLLLLPAIQSHGNPRNPAWLGLERTLKPILLPWQGLLPKAAPRTGPAHPSAAPGPGAITSGHSGDISGIPTAQPGAEGTDGSSPEGPCRPGGP